MTCTHAGWVVSEQRCSVCCWDNMMELVKRQVPADISNTGCGFVIETHGEDPDGYCWIGIGRADDHDGPWLEDHRWLRDGEPYGEWQAPRGPIARWFVGGCAYRISNDWDEGERIDIDIDSLDDDSVAAAVVQVARQADRYLRGCDR